MAYYYMAEVNDLNKEGKRLLYPRLVHMHQVNRADVAEKIANRSSFTKGDVVGLFAAMAEVLSEELAMGNSVKIEEIGTFTAGLGLKEGVEREQVDGEKQLNAQSIEVQKVYFRPDKDLLLKTDSQMRLERKTKKARRVESTKEERIEWLKGYLAEHKEIRVRQYAELTGLSRPTASRELRQFNHDRLIYAHGRGTHFYYTLPKSEGEE